MADLIIRGMEMPRDCSMCALLQNRVFACSAMCSITGQTVGYYDQGFHLEKHDCPLLPLPEGHGKIIDGDALWENMTVEQSEAFQKGLAGTIELFEMLEAATPIVPAEGGGKDG